MKNTITSAFTMIELILALVIIGAALLPILSTYSASHQNTKVTLEEVIAVNFASELIEALQALPFEQLCLINSDITFMDGEFNPDPFAIASSQENKHSISQRTLPDNFKINVLVNSYPISGYLIEDTSLVHIQVTINWGTRNREVILTTLKGKY